MRAIGDGPRNFDPQPCNEDDTCHRKPSPNYHTRWVALNFDRFNGDRVPLYSVSSGTPRQSGHVMITIRLYR
ncbi:hypothetical protein TNCV_2262391 [Trichonephila clavipes]|nr:hypothetical protein TNCV_2262391 [Trichonephila clavipes]